MNQAREPIIITKFLEIDQPVGRFIVCAMKPSDLLRISSPQPREYDSGLDKFIGIQRQLDKSKIKELKEYVHSADACFPNSIIANLDTSFLLSYSENEIKIKVSDDESRALFIIDGQHRVKSFENENLDNFELIVAIFLGLGIEDQAYLFSTINNKQKRLNMSLVQDLNDLFVVKTPEKLVHVITKIFNEEKDSPWKDKIKILGKNIEKNGEQTAGIMSQYSFAKEIIKLIVGGSKDYFKIRDILKKYDNNRSALKKEFSEFDSYSDKFIFWNYYIENKEDFIYLSLSTYFNAISMNFDGWGDKDSILTKTTGYIAFMRFYEYLFRKTKNKENFIEEKFFTEVFNKIKNKNVLEALNSTNYVSGVAGQTKLFNHLKESYG